MPLSTVLGAQSLIKPGVCTTATRPASPYTGQMIYDTDVATTLVWNGTEWIGSYTTFTPSWVNLTLGNALNTARYIRIGKFIHLTARLVFGTTTVMTGNPLRFNLPINANTTSNNPPAGSIFIADTGVTSYQGFGIIGGGDNLICYISNAAGTYLVPAAITATAPMTWGNTDELILSISYESV